MEEEKGNEVEITGVGDERALGRGRGAGEGCDEGTKRGGHGRDGRRRAAGDP